MKKAQSLAKTSQTLSKKEKELAAVQKKTTLTKEALIHARDLDYIGKRTFLGNYSLTEEEFSKLKKQADHGYMMDVENRRLKEELSTAKKETVMRTGKDNLLKAKQNELQAKYLTILNINMLKFYQNGRI